MDIDMATSTTARHAQHDTARHIEAYYNRIDFTTWGNLSGRALKPTEDGTPQYAPSFGYMSGGAALQYAVDRQNGVIDYVLLSYATPIAWHTRDGVWHVDCERHGAASDKALGQARSITERTFDEVRLYNYRHGLSPAQITLLQNGTSPDGYIIQGSEKRTARSLWNTGYIMGGGPLNLPVRTTKLGRAILMGKPVRLIEYLPFKEAVA